MFLGDKKKSWVNISYDNHDAFSEVTFGYSSAI